VCRDFVQKQARFKVGTEKIEWKVVYCRGSVSANYLQSCEEKRREGHRQKNTYDGHRADECNLSSSPHSNLIVLPDPLRNVDAQNVADDFLKFCIQMIALNQYSLCANNR
jgi:hypothetical protein